MTKDTSVPAFPASEVWDRDLQDFTHKQSHGMTLRQYAAIKAMQGLLAECGGSDIEYVVMKSVRAADTLLAELAKGE